MVKTPLAIKRKLQCKNYKIASW